MEWWQDPELIEIATVIGEPLLWFIILLFGYLLVLRPFIKHHTRAPESAAATPAGLNVQVGGDDDEDAEGEFGDDGEPYKNPRRNKALGYQQKLAELQQTARENPHIVALIVRNWLKQ
jgi:flagellar M-ring protein FliF